MYKRIYILVLALSYMVNAAKAQPAFDTIKNSLKEKPTLFAKIDTRNSFISNSRAKILGVKSGLNYGHRLHFGIGYNQLYGSAKDFDKQLYYTNTDGFTDSITVNLHLFYISAYVEYIFYKTKNWSLSMPLQLGIGQTYYKDEQSALNKTYEKNLNFIYEPAVSIEYKFLKWFGVGADIGFRFMITADKKLDQKFTSPTYAFKLLIYYNEIYKSLFSNKKSG